MRRIAVLSAFVLLSSAGAAFAGEGKWGGYVFGDAFMYAGHHVKQYQGHTGFQIRRVYLNYDYDFGEGWSSRARLEMAYAEQRAAGNGGNTVPFAKDLWLKKKFAGVHSGIFGLQPTPTFGTEEDFWGYRAVEKAPVDLQGWRSSRDTGIAFKGNFTDEKMFGYHFLAANGESTRQELNKNKNFYLELTAKPVKGLVVSAYGDYINNNMCGVTSWQTWGASASGEIEECQPRSSQYMGRLFVGYEGGWGRVGASYTHSVIEQYMNGTRWPTNGDANNAYNAVFDAGDNPRMNPDAHQNLWSVFGVAKVHDKVNLLARYDYLDYPAAPSPTYFDSNIDNARMHFMVFGVDYNAVKSVHLIPNIEIMSYGDSIQQEGVNSKDGGRVQAGESGRAIVIPRLTFFWKFK